jgi:hypothetical protein
MAQGPFFRAETVENTVTKNQQLTGPFLGSASQPTAVGEAISLKSVDCFGKKRLPRNGVTASAAKQSSGSEEIASLRSQ